MNTKQWFVYRAVLIFITLSYVSARAADVGCAVEESRFERLRNSRPPLVNFQVSDFTSIRCDVDAGCSLKRPSLCKSNGGYIEVVGPLAVGYSNQNGTFVTTPMNGVQIIPDPLNPLSVTSRTLPLGLDINFFSIDGKNFVATSARSFNNSLSQTTTFQNVGDTSLGRYTSTESTPLSSVTLTPTSTGGFTITGKGADGIDISQSIERYNGPNTSFSQGWCRKNMFTNVYEECSGVRYGNSFVSWNDGVGNTMTPLSALGSWTRREGVLVNAQTGAIDQTSPVTFLDSYLVEWRDGLPGNSVITTEVSGFSTWLYFNWSDVLLSSTDNTLGYITTFTRDSLNREIGSSTNDPGSLLTTTTRYNGRGAIDLQTSNSLNGSSQVSCAFDSVGDNIPASCESSVNGMVTQTITNERQNGLITRQTIQTPNDPHSQVVTTYSPLTSTGSKVTSVSASGSTSEVTYDGLGRMTYQVTKATSGQSEIKNEVVVTAFSNAEPTGTITRSWANGYVEQTTTTKTATASSYTPFSSTVVQVDPYGQKTTSTISVASGGRETAVQKLENGIIENFTVTSNSVPGSTQSDETMSGTQGSVPISSTTICSGNAGRPGCNSVQKINGIQITDSLNLITTDRAY